MRRFSLRALILRRLAARASSWSVRSVPKGTPAAGPFQGRQRLLQTLGRVVAGLSGDTVVLHLAMVLANANQFLLEAGIGDIDQALDDLPSRSGRAGPATPYSVTMTSRRCLGNCGGVKGTTLDFNCLPLPRVLRMHRTERARPAGHVPWRQSVLSARRR